jgi:TPR repeat protein
LTGRIYLFAGTVVELATGRYGCEQMGEVKSMNKLPSDGWYEAVISIKSGGIGTNDISREIFNETFDAFMSGEFDKAYQGFLKMAEAGSSVSQYYLAVMFLNGKGVLQDYCLAHMWLNIASSRGHDKARRQLEKLTRNMTAEQVADAQQQAGNWVNSQSSNGASGE